ncbi:hypothetical protein QG37_04779 [Candidozyma auris]|uniref:Uncharacterized protein n=1 Tax=Candidozyma auris TaxID=498019 RepID=A0A0L0NW94_CANAR|nr:hypothetical protein QG37_04779 [[Candida] auris]
MGDKSRSGPQNGSTGPWSRFQGFPGEAGEKLGKTSEVT